MQNTLLGKKKKKREIFKEFQFSTNKPEVTGKVSDDVINLH